uniref:Uncharacterized protein n=1 Tax=Arundo donax TaxID=35708 RepID=A0A0A9F4E7_ARUDO
MLPLKIYKQDDPLRKQIACTRRQPRETNSFVHHFLWPELHHIYV